MNKEIITYAPGRINIIGEHTDYNRGFVLPAAIDKRTTTKIVKNGHPTKCIFHSENLNEQFEFDLDKMQPSSNSWHNYALGVINELKNLGAKFTGFHADINSDVPLGGGISSSAALECSFAYGLNSLFSLGFDEWQIIKACQMAEHNYVGIKCGIMDQFTSVMGKENKVILLDCKSLEYEYHPLDLMGYQLYLLDTNVSHELANSAYNMRREYCEMGVQYFQKFDDTVTSLRDIDLDLLEQNKTNLDPEIYAKCKHVIKENNRVLEATKALQCNHLAYLGQLMYDSHESLQYDYTVSCEELDFLVDKTKNKAFVLGSRMMGGGFGGSTINLIKNENVDQFVQEISKLYLDRYAKELSVLKVNIGNGAHYLNVTKTKPINI